MNGRARARGFGLMGFPLIWGLFRRVTIVEHLFLLEFLGLFRRIKFFTLSALEPRKMNQHKGILLGDKKFSENSSNKPTSSTHGHSSTPNFLSDAVACAQRGGIPVIGGEIRRSHRSSCQKLSIVRVGLQQSVLEFLVCHFNQVVQTTGSGDHSWRFLGFNI